ncbi:MAG: hypothetical protein CVT59_11010 [Actinobacteria bacterium HGW-Actinobacteria-1]|jgi:hypothetical protein|nr:MAG: hypothetical protein CVT59_11010 [Actinobacteria bacterium HGW-Actinobacteria-1]
MRITSNEVSAEGKTVVRVRVDRIGAAGDRELWWVALAFEDETTKPEGMFTDKAQALGLAGTLASEWGVQVALTDSALA